MRSDEKGSKQSSLRCNFKGFQDGVNQIILLFLSLSLKYFGQFSVLTITITSLAQIQVTCKGQIHVMFTFNSLKPFICNSL